MSDGILPDAELYTLGNSRGSPVPGISPIAMSLRQVFRLVDPLAHLHAYTTLARYSLLL